MRHTSIGGNPGARASQKLEGLASETRSTLQGPVCFLYHKINKSSAFQYAQAIHQGCVVAVVAI